METRSDEFAEECRALTASALGVGKVALDTLKCFDVVLFVAGPLKKGRLLQVVGDDGAPAMDGEILNILFMPRIHLDPVRTIVLSLVYIF